MKTADIQKKSTQALEKQAQELREKIAAFDRERFQSDDKNVRAKKLLRKDLAKTLTVLKQKLNEVKEDK